MRLRFDFERRGKKGGGLTLAQPVSVQLTVLDQSKQFSKIFESRGSFSITRD